MIRFEVDDKIELFNRIAENYFNGSFGTMTKMDFETLLFDAYVKQCEKNTISTDDYDLSIRLGITQSRVRSLKERKDLRYPKYVTDEERKAWWRNEFAQAVKNAKFDENDRCVKMIIQDVTVMSEIRHYIESRGWFDECSLNRKLLRIPVKCFVDICADGDTFQDVFNSEEVKASIRKIKMDDDVLAALLDEFSLEGLKIFLVKASKDLIPKALEALPFGGMAGEAFKALARAIEKGFSY